MDGDFDKKLWLFDIAMSKHMTGNQMALRKVKPLPISTAVTLDNGNQCLVKGEGSLFVNCSEVKNVLFVNGLTSNLISVGQLCDKFEQVQFNKRGCKVIDSVGKIIMTRVRTINNIYKLVKNDVCFSAMS
ncbi:uncharacterized protein [Rutidosis leptorrhynchoides]|uniref:uncharacterized protein n=1 Tax=Rutidosis leptorrhynchoides TaxID=125765 RepID=UPI003A9A2248